HSTMYVLCLLCVSTFRGLYVLFLYFFSAAAPAAISTLSLHDALPIFLAPLCSAHFRMGREADTEFGEDTSVRIGDSMTMGMSCRSEEHTSELQSRFDLVCRLLLEKKKKQIEESYPHKHNIQARSICRI